MSPFIIKSSLMFLSSFLTYSTTLVAIDVDDKASQTKWAIITRPIIYWATAIKLIMKRLPGSEGSN